MQLTPYLMFAGTCEDALRFYETALGGRIKELMRFEGSPAASMSPDGQKIMHATFEAGDFQLMASDGGGAKDSGSVHLSLNVDNEEQLNRVFNALSEGGKVTMPLQQTFWGATFGMLTDRFGINWMFNLEGPGGSGQS